MPRNWDLRIRDILDAIGKIVAHVQSLDFERFAGDAWTMDAVLRNLTVA